MKIDKTPKILQTVALENATVFAFHGFYPEEQKIGGWFSVNVYVSFFVDASSSDDLSQTINYEYLYQVLREEMLCTQKLIETVGQNILNRINYQFRDVERICVEVRKNNPPLGGKVQNSLVKLEWNK